MEINLGAMDAIDVMRLHRVLPKECEMGIRYSSEPILGIINAAELTTDRKVMFVIREWVGSLRVEPYATIPTVLNIPNVEGTENV